MKKPAFRFDEKKGAWIELDGGPLTDGQGNTLYFKPVEARRLVLDPEHSEGLQTLIAAHEAGKSTASTTTTPAVTERQG